MPPPDRWLDYCPIGKVIPKTKFIAFKVPLKLALLEGVSEKDKFTPDALMSSIQEQGAKLGMVIDLTFTRKYYNSQEFEKHSILYKKIFVQGAKSGQTVPNDANFLEFVGAVKGFTKVASDDQVIGVHCTHGLNRTGYLICRYMIEEMDFEPSEAIKMFDEARGHNIERETYLKDLLDRKKGVATLSSVEEAPAESEYKDRRHYQGENSYRQEHRPYSRPSYYTGASRYSHNERVNMNYNNQRDLETNSRSYQQAGWSTSSNSHFKRHDGYNQDYKSWRENNSVGGRERHWNQHSNFDSYEHFYHRRDFCNSYSSQRGYRSTWSRFDTRQGFRSDNSQDGHRGDKYQEAGWSTKGHSISEQQQYGQFGRKDY